MNQKFNTGQIISTNSISELSHQFPKFSEFISDSMRKHITGDWGDLEPEDKKSNDNALDEEYPDRILSCYNLPEQIPGVFDNKVYIITEHDRSVTTILFPSEY